MPIDRVFGRKPPAPPSEPPGDSSSSDRKPIGVPEDFTTKTPRQYQSGYYPSGYSYPQHAYPGQAPSDPVTQGPRYYEGDQFTPGAASPESIADLQRDMVKAGLIGPSTNIRIGVWDQPTQKAYQQLLATANARGLDANMTLNDMAAAPQTHPGGAQGQQYQAPPLQIRTTNKDDLRRVMRSAVIDKMGEGWSQAQIDELVDGYNWKEIQVQKDAYDQQVALERAAFEGGPGGGQITQEDMPSPETFIDTAMQKKDPVGYQAGKVTNELIPEIFSNLKGWV